MPRRRSVLAFAAVVLGGCGFELKQAPKLGFRTIQLVGFSARSPLEKELRINIDATPTTRVVDSAAQADVVLQALTDERDKIVVASSAVGQVTEFQLRSRFRFRLRTVGGKVLIPETELVQSRDMSYTESAELGKEQEETTLYRAMQSDIVAQVMRRLASVRGI